MQIAMLCSSAVAPWISKAAAASRSVRLARRGERKRQTETHRPANQQADRAEYAKQEREIQGSHVRQQVVESAAGKLSD